MVDVDAALKHMFNAGGSDLHIKVPAPPMMRLNGVLEPIPDTDKVMPDDALEVLKHITRDKPEKYAEFEEAGEVDFAYPLPGVARFRVNAFTQRGSASIVMRAIGIDIKTIDELLLPPAIRKLAEEERGVILVTGTTGSGKSTTLAAMIKHINDKEAKHIITLEDPIEFLHRDSKSIIQQREIGADTATFGAALRRILRQDPDVILIGEMRDEETVQTALSSAETGHLVFSTLHTLNATETINRIIDFFPLHQNKQVRAMLAGTLQGIISQRLVRTKDGKGRVPIVEVMVATNRIKDMIVDPEQTAKIEIQWAQWGCGVHLIALPSPYRSVLGSLLDYIEGILDKEPDCWVTVVIPEILPARWWQNILHNHRALLLKGALLFKDRVVLTDVPFHLTR